MDRKNGRARVLEREVAEIGMKYYHSAIHR